MKVLSFNKVLFGLATLGFMFITTACPSPQAGGCLEAVNCGPNEIEDANCVCQCLSGYTRVGNDCVKIELNDKLEADITGTDITGVFHYTAAGVDLEFRGDSLLIDGYIDEADPSKSSHIFIRLVDSLGNDIVSGRRYDVSTALGKGASIATQRYPFAKSNEYYAIDTGSIYINSIDQTAKTLDATFSFSCKSGNVGEIRYVKNGWVKTAQ
jgi:hypothetical protein